MATFDDIPALVNSNAGLSNGIIDNLIQTFLHNKEKCCFDIDARRLRDSLNLDDSDPDCPHPCFVNAILLLGCYFSRPLSTTSQHENERRFLSKTLAELTRAYNQADRLHDFIRASNLVVYYYLFNGYREADQQLAQSILVTTQCGLHQIPSPVWRAPSPRSERGYISPPADNLELGQRIHTFWNTFTLDKIISLAIPGYLSALVEGPACHIITPWPRLLKEYDNGKVSELDVASLGHLLNGEFIPSRYPQPQPLDKLQAEGIALVSEAIKVVEYRIRGPQVTGLNTEIERFIIRVPDITCQGDMGEIPGYAINPRLVYIKTLSYAASFYLNQEGSDQASRDRSISAVDMMVSILNQLGQDDFGRLFIGIGYIWIHVSDIFIEILRTLQRDGAGMSPRAQLIRNNFDSFIQGLNYLSAYYPALGPRIHMLLQRLDSIA
ncbi:hypothetical protein FRC02_005215 [Tulasnella sp. 418]|nr:hypothetical protein FRC02_005215 [Tulasnella sp. 418]